jgi:hypothetical protein
MLVKYVHVLVPRDCKYLLIFTPSQDSSHESIPHSFINEHTQSSTNHFWWYIIRIWYIALKLIIHINASVQQLCLLDISLLPLMALAAPYSTLMTSLSFCCLTVHHAILVALFKQKPEIKQRTSLHQAKLWQSTKCMIRSTSLCKGSKDVWENGVENIWTEGAEVAEDFRKITRASLFVIFSKCYIGGSDREELVDVTC